MSLAFSSRRSRRMRGGSFFNDRLYDNVDEKYGNWYFKRGQYSNQEGERSAAERNELTTELSNLKDEYLASFGIKYSNGPSSNAYVKYMKKYGRNPITDAAVYAKNVQPKLHTNTMHNLNTIKATSRRKALNPNPIKRLFRRNRQTRRKAVRRL